jgi:hypothetical protein
VILQFSCTPWFTIFFKFSYNNLVPIPLFVLRKEYSVTLAPWCLYPTLTFKYDLRHKKVGYFWQHHRQIAHIKHVRLGKRTLGKLMSSILKIRHRGAKRTTTTDIQTTLFLQNGVSGKHVINVRNTPLGELIFWKISNVIQHMARAAKKINDAYFSMFLMIGIILH